MLIFLDTEFTNLTQPTLISIGLVADSGEELYLESSEFCHADCSQFVREVVLPQLGKTADATVDRSELKRRILSWLEQFFDRDRVKVVYDYDGDWILLRDVVDGEIPEWMGHENIWRDVSDLLVERFFMETGLTDHHALNDAKANRYAYRQ